MLLPKLSLFNLVVVLHFAKTQRRIKDGSLLEQEKRYTVYLVKAPGTPRVYDAWLCGGAIVSTFFIVTSAACVEDVQNMFAVAGYNKYVATHELDSDECTRTMRKRIMFTCVPKGYDFEFDKVEKWSFIDIAAVRVETAFRFEDERYTTLCSYQPMRIDINYERKHQEPGIDSMVLGWGHVDKWRKPGDPTDYNEERLRFASTRIHNKEECKKFFTDIDSMSTVIDKYMICTLEAGNIDDKGNELLKSRPIADGCTHNEELLRQGEVVCVEDETVLVDARKTFSNVLKRQQNMTRRQGFCQNDHGGPLVTWVGKNEVLIGVASVFRVTEDFLCTGPFLYTSTQCNSAFLDCVINGGGKTRRRDICDKSPRERGFDKIERYVSWDGYPEGPEGKLETDNSTTTQVPQVTTTIDDYYDTWDLNEHLDLT